VKGGTECQEAGRGGTDACKAPRNAHASARKRQLEAAREPAARTHTANRQSSAMAAKRLKCRPPGQKRLIGHRSSSTSDVRPASAPRRYRAGTAEVREQARGVAQPSHKEAPAAAYMRTYGGRDAATREKQTQECSARPPAAPGGASETRNGETAVPAASAIRRTARKSPSAYGRKVTRPGTLLPRRACV